MKRSLYSLLVLLVLGQLPATPGQCRDAATRNLERAEYLYNHLAYAEAIKYYEKLAEANPGDVSALSHLGDCYRLTKNPVQAAYWYGKAASSGELSDESKLHYAEVLMSLSRYDEAAGLLRKYQASVPGDRRVANLLTSCAQNGELAGRIPEGVATLLAFNTDGSDFGPTLLSDKRLVFTTDSLISNSARRDQWTGAPYYNIYGTSCATSGKCDGGLERLGAKINSRYHDGPCTFSKDGSTMFFTRTTLVTKFLGERPQADRSGTVHLEILEAYDYNPSSGKYGKVRDFPYNDRNYSTAHPALSADGQMLVFSSDMSGGEGGSDLYMTRRDGSGRWSQPVSLGKEINTEGEEMFPTFLDERTISFASNGHVGLGGLDLYYASWNEQSQSWGQVEHAGTPANSPYDDMSLTLYADGQNGYFASNRPAAKREDNIYHFFRQKIYLSLKVIDSFTQKPIKGAVVSLQSLQDRRTLLTPVTGDILTNIFPQSRYDITVTKQGYRPAIVGVTTAGITGPHDTLEGLVTMTPDVNINYTAAIIDANTRQPIETPSVVIAKDGGERSDTVNLQTGENFIRSLDPGASYHLYAIKKGYFSNEKSLSTQSISLTSGPVNINDTIFMRKMGSGTVIELENIYYDFDKATIREDAKGSLKTLLAVLNDYPDMIIQINSHTDCKGSDAYNMRLSRARAQSVIEYLGSKGIKMRRLRAKGYGESKPKVDCPDCEQCTEEQRQLNRRTEFEIIKM